jgi:hypothetical protein
MNTIRKVTIVSDGIVIEFENSVTCYFPANTLYNNRLELKGQIFLNEDPSLPEITPEQKESVASDAQELPISSV